MKTVICNDLVQRTVYNGMSASTIIDRCMDVQSRGEGSTMLSSGLVLRGVLAKHSQLYWNRIQLWAAASRPFVKVCVWDVVRGAD